MTRKEARENLMQLVFQMNAQRDFSEEAKLKFIEDQEVNITKDQVAYFEEVYTAIATHKEAIDGYIEQSSDNWKIQRIAQVDLAILRLAVAEMAYCEGIPHSVSINEAVELGKKYGSNDSSKFVNGVLGKVFKNL